MQIMRCLIYLFFAFSFTHTSFALDIPSHLSQADRRDVVRTLGMNLSPKLLGNPYPLGGYAGFEASLSLEFVDITELATLGCEPGTSGCPNQTRSDEKELRYSRITLGKGLFHDLDMFVHFIPPQGGLRLSDFAGSLRWSFLEATFAPINVSLLTYINQVDFGGSFSSQTIGSEVIAGITVDNFSLYFGGGFLKAKGKFIGGTGTDSLLDPTDPTINADTNTATERVDGTHSVFGASLQISTLFVAAQIDRYRDPVFSTKIGLRF